MMQKQTRSLFKSVLAGVLLVTSILPVAGLAQESDGGSNEEPSADTSSSGQGTKSKKKSGASNDNAKQNSRPKPAEPERSPPDFSQYGLGLALGSNSPVGNGLTLHYAPLRYVEVRTGVGYNTTGTKAGIGGVLVLPIAFLGLELGGSISHSFGTTSTVEVDGQFTPEGSTKSEDIVIIRKFKASPGNFASFFAGGYYEFWHFFRSELLVNYNKVFAGHKISFEGDQTYDIPVDPTNETQSRAAAEKKATDNLAIDGLGVTLGLQVRF